MGCVTSRESSDMIGGDNGQQRNGVTVENDVKNGPPPRRPRISVTYTTTSHLKLLKSVNELRDSQIDILETPDIQKEVDNADFIQGLENPLKCSVST